MFWKNLSVSWKLFTALGLVTGLVIVFVAGVALWNTRTGFARYLAAGELVRLEPLHTVLVEMHDPQKPGWPELKNQRPKWNRLLGQTLPVPGPPPGRSRLIADHDRGGDVKKRRPPRDLSLRRPPRGAPPGLNLRVALLDLNGRRIVGGPPKLTVAAQTPLILQDENGNEEVLGFLAIAGGPDAMAASDRVFLADQARLLGLTALVALILSGLFAWFLSRQFLKPVREIATAGVRLSRGDYSVRLKSDRKDELGNLVDQYNDLAKHLESAEAVERKWVSDTSHELKTPLAVLRAQIEAVQDGVRKPGKQTLAEMHDAVMRLTRLVQDLSSLSQAREGGIALNLGEEDLGQIVGDAVDSVRDEFQHFGIGIETDLADDLILHADRLRLRQLVDNLLENSRRYTDAPGVVRISAYSDSSTVGLTIEDTAPVPKQSDRKKLFDRFYRVEASRDRRSGGSGLGLSICREIVAAHGGNIALDASDLGGLLVHVSLPKRGDENLDARI